jgi:hypothetical protein
MRFGNGVTFVAFAGDLPLSLASAMRLAAQALPLCGAAPTFLCSGKEK